MELKNTDTPNFPDTSDNKKLYLAYLYATPKFLNLKVFSKLTGRNSFDMIWSFLIQQQQRQSTGKPEKFQDLIFLNGTEAVKIEIRNKKILNSFHSLC